MGSGSMITHEGIQPGLFVQTLVSFSCIAFFYPIQAGCPLTRWSYDLFVGEIDQRGEEFKYPEPTGGGGINSDFHDPS